MIKYCTTHDSYDTDGDGVCGLYQAASEQIREALDPCELVYTECPHCGSDKGFTLNYAISGCGYEERNFNNEVLDADKHEVHDTDRFVVCLDCQQHIPTDKVMSS